MKKTSLFLNPFRWFFLGIGYICYLIYFFIRCICFSVGYTIAGFFLILLDIVTLKHVRALVSDYRERPDNKPEIKEAVSKKEKAPKKEIKAEKNKEKTPIFKGMFDRIKNAHDSASVKVKNNSIAEGKKEETLKVNTPQPAEQPKVEEVKKVEPRKPDTAILNNAVLKPDEEPDVSVRQYVYTSTPKTEEKPVSTGDINNIDLGILDMGKKNGNKEQPKAKFKQEDKVFKNVNVKLTLRERLAMSFPTLFAKKEKEIKDITNKKESDYIARPVNKDEKEPPKIVYEYTAANPEGKLERSYIEAYSLVEVQSYLLSEGYDIYRIRTNQSMNIFHRSATGKKRIKTSDLVFFLTQLSTYIKAGITLTESVDILSRQFKDKYYQKIFRSVANALKSGDNFSEALAKTGNAFPKLLINMVKTAELTGDLPETLDDMADYYSEMDKTRKQMKSALTYPTIVLVLAIGVIAFVLIYVIPKFTTIYESMNAASIPKLTLVIIDISNFIKTNYYYIALAFIIILLIIRYFYQNRVSSRAFMQKIAMKIPVLRDIIIYNEVTTFTKTFSSLLKHGVFITDTMNILLQVTNNEIYKKLIFNCINYLNKGESISLAFKGHWAFPIPAYEMIVTGERTGKLPEMLAKVAEYYQDLHANIVSRMKVIIEPVLIVMLTGIVGLVILAVIVPMFGIYASIQ